MAFADALSRKPVRDPVLGDELGEDPAYLTQLFMLACSKKTLVRNFFLLFFFYPFLSFLFLPWLAITPLSHFACQLVMDHELSDINIKKLFDVRFHELKDAASADPDYQALTDYASIIFRIIPTKIE